MLWMLIACVGPENANERVARADCRFRKRCEEQNFNELYGADLADCIPEGIDVYHTRDQRSASCSLNRSAAAQCVSEMSGARNECDDEQYQTALSGACRDIWDC